MDGSSKASQDKEELEYFAPFESYANSKVWSVGAYSLSDFVRNRIMMISSELRERNVRLFISAPAYDERCLKLHPEVFEIFNNLRSINGPVVISNPVDYAYPLALMLDTEWHVNSIGKRRRTERLAKDIVNGL